ncbi:peptidoglycan-N-acetylmuramate O-acetyltransferase [Cytobacillus firmus]|uniref:Peptidoglycan-N-acetylmuramate O-acetyltransferase n=2 Tax=Cytobacillus TaxID=2675230 RepID=A0A366K3X9_CYTFI|nr:MULTISPECIES: acyltransferase family protein [Cytobacillus]RBP95833.1 peptidoglycan-N-acetylmuramate O-acetyltransferase [Cytobacillus firmus]TDX44746.1 peptidoglycan-N-acetylmuramate O-acetyltransferase [Cytobacillus oceanisediminis]
MSVKVQNHRYIHGLDGLRALAVLFVIAYHFNFSWAKGGFLGVNIFFVLSGYLITSIMIPSQGQRFTINLRNFWIGRMRRLIPAAYVMILITIVWVTLFNRELLHTVRGDAISSIFYTSNWWFIFHEVSYFDSFGSPSPLKNLWSLAIEEQFYIIWPIVLTIGLYIYKKQCKLAIFVFSSAICSAMLMGLLYESGKDPSRVYYGTDTRSFELLIGCWLALVWPMKRLSSKKLSVKLHNTLNITSIISLVIFIICLFFVNEYQVFLYRGGMFLICMNAAILIACICHPASLLGKILAWKPLRWIGTRSYGLYLWHYPVIVLSTPVYEIGNPAFGRVALQLTFTLIIAELSYRLIETPIQKHGFQSFFQRHIVINRIKWKSLSFSRKTLTGLIPLVLLVFITGITGLVNGAGQKGVMASNPAEVKIIGGESSGINDTNMNQKSPASEIDSSVQDLGEEFKPETEQNKETPQKEKKNTNDKPLNLPNTGILAIGDSVMIDMAPSLQKIYPDITIDAKIGRQVSQAIKLAPGYADFNHPDKTVIIQLGTNGYFTNQQMDTLLSTFSEAHIYLVNTRVPRPWEGKVNQALYKKSLEYENVTLIDWHSEAIDHPEYFAADGVHLLPKGIETLTDLINQSIFHIALE